MTGIREGVCDNEILVPIETWVRTHHKEYLIREARERNYSVGYLVRLIIEQAIKTAEEAKSNVD